ncbi:carbohydrate ABC transporter permease [Mycoplasma enhydrae]|uniref:carbohydrate ABC transporter permease n=1 Tax=Mycoplasma enhydrae TaxID=2499220 RepID=UPI00197B7D07|nr:carbohydrate ABC transporter permease [Mycoplasma enhydrae]MBN4089278.1 carbohydrate ABC transporter permease [Mycoplasma enhydrae]MCV3733562.1 carbohydrate ABC transporter permease [Mycoplasma enhydrae]MCV3753462.1 carbohydrate ABC transporter permease [Mycoplasma enhydrae]
MLLIKLKNRQWREKLSLRSKQELMSKPYSTTNVLGKFLEWGFKISILTFFSILIILPFYFMIEQSLVDRRFYTEEASSKIAWWPFDWKSYEDNGKEFKFGLKTSFHFENIKDAFQKGYWQALIFTASYTTISVMVRLFFAITLGYALAMRKWRGKNAFFGFLLSLMVIPEITLITMQYTFVSKANWLNTNSPVIIVALIIPFATSIFNAYMYKNAFEAIPNSVKESSMLDGASGFKYFFNIALPMVKATTWTVVILTALSSWNSYTWPAVLWTSTPGETAGYWSPINLWLFTTGRIQQKTEDSSEVQKIVLSIRMAATVLAILPMMLIYLLLRKRIMAAISRQGNATKG